MHLNTEEHNVEEEECACHGDMSVIFMFLQLIGKMQLVHFCVSACEPRQFQEQHKLTFALSNDLPDRMNFKDACDVDRTAIAIERTCNETRK